MPNRIIREGANSSERVDALSAEAERFYRRLLNVVDDFGRYDGRPAILLSRCFPLREDITGAMCGRWLAECASGDDPLVSVYTVDRKPYVVVHNFNQQRRAKDSKWPHPPSDAHHVIADAKHPISDATHVLADSNGCSLKSESESECKAKAKGKSESESESHFDLDDEFERAWKRWPAKGRTRRPLCETNWTEVFLTVREEDYGEMIAAIHEGIDRWLVSALFAKGFVHGFADFLAQRRWAEEPEPDARSIPAEPIMRNAADVLRELRALSNGEGD